MYYPMYYYGFDWTYILVLIGALISILASANVQNTFRRYSNVRAGSGLNAEEAARMILQSSNIYDVSIQGIRGNLTDNYVPSKKVLNLSESTRYATSIAAIGVAAHECGHAIQDARDYVPLRLTGVIHPICAFSSQISIPIIIVGLLLSIGPLINLGIFLFVIAISVQILTLPVEFDASRRAVAALRANGMMTEEELSGVKAVLTAAALTYVAAAASSILQLLRLILLSRNRRDD